MVYRSGAAVLILSVLIALVDARSRPVRRSPVARGSLVSSSMSNDVIPPYKTVYFDNYIDHFNYPPGAIATFRHKVLVSDVYWDKNPNSPWLFYCGNEGAIELFYQNSGEMFWLAEQLHALLVFPEHRYYGESLPFGKQSFVGSNWQYLSTDQALADYSYFLVNYKLQMNAPNAPVVAFGGSYGGMLATWFRVKYPHLTVGSLGASGPIAQFTGLTPPEAFNQKVTQDYREADAFCPIAIRSAFAVIENRFNIATQAGFEFLQQNLNLCAPLKSTDFNNLVGYYENIFTDLAMIDYPYATSFLAPVPANPVNVTCRSMLGSLPASQSQWTDALVLKAMTQAAFLYYNSTGQIGSCYNISTPDSPDLGDMAWTYQTCTEMPMPIGSDGINDMFVNQPWDFGQWTQYCKQTFGTVPQAFAAQIRFGGRALSTVKNVFTSQGSLDPWSTGGLYSSPSADMPFCLIEGGAHHLDLRYPNPADPPSCVECRQRQLESIKTWLNSA
eukprot:ANDGO_04035.mRNA.1 Prolyl carboxy peptidase like protein 5